MPSSATDTALNIRLSGKRSVPTTSIASLEWVGRASSVSATVVRNDIEA
ncbi:MAG: hypothetical protein U0470_07915 [Anaerolineae bacterium]